MMKDRVMLSVGQEVKEAAMKMGKDLGVSVARMGEEILTTYAKIEFERISQSIRILEAAEVSPGDEREAAVMMDRLRKEREPFRKLAEIYDREEQRKVAAIEKAIDEHLASEKGVSVSDMWPAAPRIENAIDEHLASEKGRKKGGK